MNKCSQCNHLEEDHDPKHGRCFHEENLGSQEDLCPCSGFNKIYNGESYLDSLLVKAGVKK